MKMKTLRGRMVLIFGLLVTSLLIILGFFVYRDVSNTIEPLTDKLVSEIVEARSGVVTENLSADKNYLEVIGEDSVFQSDDLEKIGKHLASKQTALDGRFVGLWFADKSGNMVSSLGDRSNIKGREDYEAIMTEGREINISDPINSTIAKAPVVNMSIPVKGKGVLTGIISLESLGNLVGGVSVGENGFGIVLDRNGEVIGAGLEEHILNFNVNTSSEKGFVGLDKLPSELEKNNMGVLNFKDDQGVEKVFIYSAIEESNGWVLGVMVPTDDIRAESYKVLNTIIISIVGTIVVMLAGVYLISSRITRPIVEGIEFSKHIANLDTTRSISQDLLAREDEIGELANSLKMVNDSLRDFIGSLGDTADEVLDTSNIVAISSNEAALATEEITQAVNQVAEGATEQARETEDGSLRISEMEELINKEVDYMEKVLLQATEVVDLNEGGMSAVKELIDRTKESFTSVQKVREGIKETSESTARINEATRLIRNIAEETNLLALNAAIEAARAGDSGRGFAVVASEIRELAEDSGELTDQVEKMVLELERNSNNSVEIIESVLEISKIQARSVGETQNRFREISQAIEKAAVLIDELSLAVDETDVKKNEIVSILQNLAAIAEENAAATEETAASTEEQSAAVDEISNASKEMANISKRLKEELSQFKI